MDRRSLGVGRVISPAGMSTGCGGQQMSDTEPKPENQAKMRQALAHELCLISGYAYAETIYYGRAEQIIEALAEAGFVIVPREPSAGMIEAGRNVGPDAPYGVSETAKRWRAMVDEALK